MSRKRREQNRTLEKQKIQELGEVGVSRHGRAAFPARGGRDGTDRRPREGAKREVHSELAIGEEPSLLLVSVSYVCLLVFCSSHPSTHFPTGDCLTPGPKVSLVLEAAADEQLKNFKAAKAAGEDVGNVCQRGAWASARARVPLFDS